MSQHEESESPLPALHGFVVLVDALGTKGATAHLQPSVISKRWAQFLDNIEVWKTDLNNEADTQASIAHSIPFSDTVYVCIESPRDTCIDDVVLLDSFAEILYSAIGSGVFLRGAISYGLYYHSDSQVFGPAVEEAAAWYEEADWIGVSAAPSLWHLLDILERSDNLTQSERFVRWQVPFKRPELKSVSQGWALGWPLAAIDATKVKSDIQTAFIEFGGTVPPAVLPKFHNTLDFIDDVLESETPKH